MKLFDTYMAQQGGLTHYGCEAMERIIAAADYTYMKEHADGSCSFVSRIDTPDSISELITIEVARSGNITHHYGDVDGQFSGTPRARDLEQQGWIVVEKHSL